MPRQAALVVVDHTGGRSGVSQCCCSCRVQRAALPSRQRFAQVLRHGGEVVRLRNGITMCPCVWCTRCSDHDYMLLSRDCCGT